MANGIQESNDFDYIVCGGGTAGCVVAARLAEEPNVSVLLLEAGGPKGSVPASAIPAAVAQILGTSADWNIYNQPCAELDDRQLHLGRGKFIGGTSGCNGTLCIRGTQADYDDWGIEGWSGKEVFHYMSKAETFRNKDWFEATEGAHGDRGPVVIAPHDPAPISNRVLESFQDKGLSLVPDLFTSGDVVSGCGHTVRTIYQGVRSTAADYLTGQSNIRIKTNVYVDKLVFDGSKSQASGVEVRTEDGKSTIYRANKEIVLSAGTYGTPAILLRSGIGPKQEVEKLGLDNILDLPGVGRNLQDHLVMLIFYEVSESGLTNDNLVWHQGARETSMKQYKSSRTGFLSQFPFGSFAYSRLDERLANEPLWRDAERKPGRDPLGTLPSQPHIEFWNTECYSPKYLYRDFPSDGEHAFALCTEFFSPRSRGEVTISTLDPTQNPVVDHRYLTDPLDMLVFTEACKLANEIVLEGKGTRDVVKGSWPPSYNHHTFKTRKEWEPAIKARADTCYHPAGTCKMGAVDDSMAVVDAHLKLNGIKGVRIADASIIPTLMSGHPQMACYAIGEKAADMIKGVAPNKA